MFSDPFFYIVSFFESVYPLLYELKLIYSPDYQWFFVIGKIIIIVFLFNIFRPSLGRILNLRVARIRTKPKSANTQKRFIQSKGPENFFLSLRFSGIMVQIVITCTFSSGIPGVWFLTSFSFILLFWIDKFIFIRYVKKPPKYTKQFLDLIQFFLPVALIAGTVFAIQVNGNFFILDISQYFYFFQSSFEVNAFF